MVKRNRRGMYLTRRDLELFDYLFLHKIATADQINRDLFHAADVRDARKRLRTLTRGGYLRRSTVEADKPKYAFHLTELAFERHLSSRTRRPWAQLKSDSPLHDVRLVDIRRRFLRSPKVAAFLTENAIEAEFGCPADLKIQPFLEMHSDAAIVFRPHDEPFVLALEYENSEQNRSRYEEQFASYYIRDEIHGVIYIVKGENLRERLVQIEKMVSHNARPKVFFGEVSDVLDPTKGLHFVNHRGEVLQVD